MAAFHQESSARYPVSTGFLFLCHFPLPTTVFRAAQMKCLHSALVTEPALGNPGGAVPVGELQGAAQRRGGVAHKEVTAKLGQGIKGPGLPGLAFKNTGHTALIV